MKKIAVLLILSLALTGVLAGCAKDSNDNKVEDSDNTISPTPAEENNTEIEDNNDGNDTFAPIDNPVAKEDYDFNDYIKLGKYKGIEVKVEQLEVTDEDVDVYIQMALNDSGSTPIEVTDRTVKLGDTISIDFTGYHEGEAFEGGAAEGYVLTVGSGTFIEGFEDQLIGAELNKEIDVNVVFPENYSNTTLAGEPAVFKVKVNSIQYFELTPEFVIDVMGFASDDDYRESVYQDLVAENEDWIASKKESDVYNAVVNGSEITLPDNLIDYYESDIKTLYTNIAASYGMDFETFITLSGSSVERFEADVQRYARNMATRELIIKAITVVENIEVTEEEFLAEVAEYAVEYGYESTEEFLANADEKVLREDILFNKIVDFLLSEAIEI